MFNLGSFSSVCHFLGYQGRCAIPTQFDRNLAFTYGRIARILVEQKITGYSSSARGLVEAPNSWFPLALPITHMFNIKDKSTLILTQANTDSTNLSSTLLTSTSNLPVLKNSSIRGKSGNSSTTTPILDPSSTSEK